MERRGTTSAVASRVDLSDMVTAQVSEALGRALLKAVEQCKEEWAKRPRTQSKSLTRTTTSLDRT